MLGKLVLCAVLYSIFSVGCLARPQENTNDKGELASLFNTNPEARDTECRQTLRLVVWTVSRLGYEFARLFVELLAAPIESIKCVTSGNFLKCTQSVVGDTWKGCKNTIGDTVGDVKALAQYVGKGVQSCLLSKNSVGYDLFLKGNDNLNLDFVKSLVLENFQYLLN